MSDIVKALYSTCLGGKIRHCDSRGMWVCCGDDNKHHRAETIENLVRFLNDGQES